MTETVTQKSRSVSLPPEHAEIDLRQLFNLIKHNWKLVAIVTFIFMMLGIYYAETRPPEYRSTAMIELSNDNPSAGLGSSGSPMNLMALQQGSASDVETVLLQSPYILSHVVRQMGMDISVTPQYSGFFAKKISQWRGMPHEISINAFNVPNDLLAKPLTLIVRGSDQYSLVANDGKKILDGRVGISTTGSYLSRPVQIEVEKINAQADTTFSITKLSTRAVAQGLGDSLKIKSEGDNTGVLGLSYVSSNPATAQKLLNAILLAAVSKDLQQKSEEAKKLLNFISQQLPEYKQKLLGAELQLNKYGAEKGIFDSASQENLLTENINQLQNTLEELKFQKTILLQKFTAIHPLVIAATQKEQQVQEQINKEKTELKNLPVIGQQEFNLKGDVKIANGVYTSLLKNEQVMEMSKAGMISSVKILSSASYPVSRISVKKRSIIFGSILLGLASSLSFIFIRFVLSPVIENPDEVEKALGIPVLAIVPYSQKQVAYNKKIERDKCFAEVNPFLLARSNPRDMSIESLRSLRTSIQMSLLESKNNIIAVTGCRPGVGKSFISSNLSALISDLDKRVLIIDSDIRLGKMHLSFGKSKSPGLATFLKHEASLGNIVQTVIPNKLDFIATGLYPDNPSELLAQSHLVDLIQEIKTQYDLIIIDTPPILAVTDAVLILRLAGLNLMVLGIGKDQIKEVHHAINILEKGGANLAGIVFNTLQEPKPGTALAKYTYHYAYDNKS